MGGSDFGLVDGLILVLGGIDEGLGVVAIGIGVRAFSACLAEFSNASSTSPPSAISSSHTRLSCSFVLSMYT